MHKIWIGLLALALQAMAAGAAAQEAYVTGGGGRSSWTLDCGPSGCDRGPAAWRLGAGYRFNRAVAVEGFYVDFGRARSSEFSLDGTLSAAGLGVQGLFGWPIGDVDLAGKIGLVSLRNEFRAAGNSSYASSSLRRSELIGGLVGAWRVTPTLSIRLDLDIVTVALDGDTIYYARGSDVTAVTLGLMVRF
jgi:hypothetical protein